MERTHVNDGLSRQEILEILKESKLLSADELARAEAIAPNGDGAALAKALVERGPLTAFQMDHVLNRKHEKLKIGNYDLLDKLGTGGTGTVFKARHRRLKREVALKVLSRSLCKDKTFVQRFQREVETMVQLSHPNIVMAYDADEAKVGHFLVMEFVNGQDLASLVQKQGPMGVAEAVDCILQAARGLEYVHLQGMIHRDMKPANLLRDASGTVKVTDLGLARISSTSTALASNALTQAGGVLGTVDYMPPEQALDSTNLDHRSDIYSLGATLYYLLTGQPPFPGQTMMDTLLKHRDAPIPSLCATRQDVPAALDDLYRRMMAKTTATRVQTMSGVVTSLQMIQASLSSSAMMPPSALPGAAPLPPSGSGPLPTLPRETISVPRAVSDHTMDLPSLSESVNANLSVLLVEPSRTQANIVRRILLSQNIHQVAIAPTGEDALNSVRGDKPVVILCAMYLPDMTGVDFVQHIREEYPTEAPKFILISSESENAEVVSMTQTGQAFILEKPFTPEKLVDALSVVTGQMLAIIPTTAEQLGMSLVRPLMLGPLPAASPATRRAKRRILIVDDSKAARTHYRNVLTGMGVTQFTEATDGAQAVSVLASEKFDLIISDFNMPLMDGHSLVKYVKQNPATAKTAIIVVTSESDQAKLDSLRNLGVTVCDKNFPPEVVRGILDQLPD
jgi:serine/threonine protein kinase